MNQMFIKKFNDLENSLAELKKKYLSVTEEAILASSVIVEYLESIDSDLTNYQFQSKKNEIDFFKYKLPKIYQQFFYYKTILSIENERKLHYFSKEQEIEYYINCNLKLTKISEDEKELIKYIRSNMSHLDKKFFLRKNAKWRTVNLDYTIHNTNTFNLISFIIGKSNALEFIVKYINDKIQQLKNPNEFRQNKPKFKLKWTAAKVLLMELIYGLYLLKVINNGEIEMVELIRQFEEFFDIDLKHYRSTIKDIRERKINRTKLIDQLKNVLTYVD